MRNQFEMQFIHCVIATTDMWAQFGCFSFNSSFEQSKKSITESYNFTFFPTNYFQMLWPSSPENVRFFRVVVEFELGLNTTQ